MKAIELKGITKHFGEILANDSINFSVDKYEIHAILGENGAGKSTLMNIMSGLVHPDSGKILIDGQKIRFKSPKDAIKCGIGMVHQHLNLIESQSVLENIILGTKTPFILRRRDFIKPILKLFDLLGTKINLDTKISDLSIGEKQKVEIVRVLYHGARILILDEPTSVLTPQEVNDLFDVIKSMRDDGYSIIIISHKLVEVLSIADRITILRKGKLMDTIHNDNLKPDDISKMMFGDDLNFAKDQPKSHHATKEILGIENACLSSPQNPDILALDHVSLEICDGEILGIAGVSGNGQLELAEAIIGLRRLNSGSIALNGKDITQKTIKEIIDLGVAYIPEDRVGVGSIQNLCLIDNIMLKCYDTFSFIENSGIKGYVKKLADKYNVVYSDLDSPVRSLSGGNLQKVIIARELRETPNLLVASYPSRGLDVKAVNFVRRILRECRENGSAILLISEDLGELLDMSDKIAVMYGGKLSMMPNKSLSEIGLAMAGQRDTS